MHFNIFKSNSSANQSTRLLKKNAVCKNYTEQNQDIKFPKSVYLIIGNEFCERYSFYALRTILALYLASELSLGEHAATSVYHGWSSYCYCTPLIGAIIADSFLGRFKTIVYISLIYVTGSIILSISAIHVPWSVHQQMVLSALGLVLIGFGTGGIKPCVAALGGDQFKLPEQDYQLTQFFYVFYFAVNAGCALSSFLTPIFRDDVNCFGKDCYALAFGVPAILMFLSLGIFVIGSNLYRIQEPRDNILGDVASCVWYATKKTIFGQSRSSHWLDIAEDKYPPLLIADIKTLFRVLFLLLPVPIFWTLFDQQSTRWLFQASRMNGSIHLFNIKPDQIQVLNPVIILFCIPIFNHFVYPALYKWKILVRPLQRMIFGGILTAAAFFISGIVQSTIENRSLMKIPKGELFVEVFNSLPYQLLVSVNGEPNQIAPSYDKIVMMAHSGITNITVTMEKDSEWVEERSVAFLINSPITESGSRHIVLVSAVNNSLRITHLPETLAENSLTEEDAKIRLITSDVTIIRPPAISNKKITFYFQCAVAKNGVTISEPLTIPAGEYNLTVYHQNLTFIRSITLEKADNRTLFLRRSKDGQNMLLDSLPWHGTELSILWIIPQYVLISLGEMFFVITGLEFIFKEAPETMKSIVQACWLLTVAVGNFFMMIVSGLQLMESQSYEYFFFSCLMVIDMILLYVVGIAHESSTKHNTEEWSFPSVISRNSETDVKTEDEI